jgi:thioredoxin reductase (NADPH)
MRIRPVLLAVDEDPEVLERLDRELCVRYASDYDVRLHASGLEAMGDLQRLADEGAAVALVLWGDCGYDIEETDVLEQVRRLHPAVKRALLIPWLAWADPHLSGVIRRSMARGRIDYYVLKPVRHPDELFHERLSNFLHEWTRAREGASYAVTVVGERRSRRVHELLDLLQRNDVPNAFVPAGAEEDGPLPRVRFPDGRELSDPGDEAVAEATGLGVAHERDDWDLIVVGAGPAGLSAGVYGSSEGMETLVVEQRAVGGQAGSSSLIRNYLGFPRGITGADLAGQAYQQAWIFGTRFALMNSATDLRRDGDRLALTLADGKRFTAGAVVLATGASYRLLDAPGVEELRGAGVFYGGAAAEAPFVGDEEVYVVGGANSAGQAALHLARHARHVTLLVRSGSLRAGMSEYLVGAIDSAHNIAVRTRAAVVAAEGDGRLGGLVIRDLDTGEERKAKTSFLFVLIGARPRTAWLGNAIARDRRGFLLTGREIPADLWELDREPLPLETSLPGVFAAGDVRRGAIKRVASAVGEGSIAVQSVHALPVARHLHSSASVPADVARTTIPDVP